MDYIIYVVIFFALAFVIAFAISKYIFPNNPYSKYIVASGIALSGIVIITVGLLFEKLSNNNNTIINNDKFSELKKQEDEITNNIKLIDSSIDETKKKYDDIKNNNDKHDHDLKVKEDVINNVYQNKLKENEKEFSEDENEKYLRDIIKRNSD